MSREWQNAINYLNLDDFVLIAFSLFFLAPAAGAFVKGLVNFSSLLSLFHVSSFVNFDQFSGQIVFTFSAYYVREKPQRRHKNGCRSKSMKSLRYSF